MDFQWNSLTIRDKVEGERTIPLTPYVASLLLTLKARKIAGREGFLILFHNADDEDRVWWNLGGWENSRHGVEIGETLDGKRGSIETGRWYDIKVDVSDGRIICALDGKVVHDIRQPRSQIKTLFASATRDKSNGDIIVKVVSSASGPADAEIELAGVGNLETTAQAIVLTSASGKDENTLEQPTKVSPRTETLTIRGSKFTRRIPGNSFTVLRIPSRK